MGEHIKNLSSFALKGQKAAIELNRKDPENKEFDIHIESPYFRCHMTDYEFMQIAACVAEAETKLKYKKKGQ